MISNKSTYYDYLAEVRRIGFWGFMREVVGLAELEKERQLVENTYYDLVQDYNALADDYQKLQEANQQLQEQLKQEIAKRAEVEVAKQELRYERLRLLQPPKALDVFYACNTENWFSHFTIEKGIIRMFHNREFYPCDVMLIPMGELRLCNQHGYPVNLVQNYAYKTLPAKRYGQPFVPDKLNAFKMRVLFGTEMEDGFWLQNPLDAQDVIMEVWANTDGGLLSEEEQDEWNAGNAQIMQVAGQRYIATLIVSFAELMNRSRSGGISKRNADGVREQCYAEYLELYFQDGNWK